MRPELDGLFGKGSTCNHVFADLRSAKVQAKLEASGYKSQIHGRGRRNHPNPLLSLAQD
jgi:hypothetical protein